MLETWVYWLARVALFALWTAIGVRALGFAGGRRTREARLARAVAVLALWLALLRATRWDWHLLAFLQSHVEASAHDPLSRGLLVLLATGAGVALIALASSVRSARGRWLGLSFVAVGFMFLFATCETFSVDELLPRVLLAQPGRYALEGGMALAAHLGLSRCRLIPARPEGPRPRPNM